MRFYNNLAFKLLIFYFFLIVPVSSLSVERYPSSLTVLNGIPVSVTVTDLQSIDNNNVTILEEGGVYPVLKWNIGFTNLDICPDYLLFYGMYNGTGGHVVVINDENNTLIYTRTNNLTAHLAFVELSNNTCILVNGSTNFTFDHTSPGNPNNHYDNYDKIWINGTTRDNISLLFIDTSIFNFKLSIGGIDIISPNLLYSSLNNTISPSIHSNGRVIVSNSLNTTIVIKPSKFNTLLNMGSTILNIRQLQPIIIGSLIILIVLFSGIVIIKYIIKRKKK